MSSILNTKSSRIFVWISAHISNSVGLRSLLRSINSTFCLGKRCSVYVSASCEKKIESELRTSIHYYDNVVLMISEKKLNQIEHIRIINDIYGYEHDNEDYVIFLRDSDILLPDISKEIDRGLSGLVALQYVPNVHLMTPHNPSLDVMDHVVSNKDNFELADDFSGTFVRYYIINSIICNAFEFTYTMQSIDNYTSLNMLCGDILIMNKIKAISSKCGEQGSSPYQRLHLSSNEWKRKVTSVMLDHSFLCGDYNSIHDIPNNDIDKFREFSCI